MKYGRWVNIRHERVESGGEYTKIVEEQTLHDFIDYQTNIKGLVNGHEIKNFGSRCDVQYLMQCVSFAYNDARKWVQHLKIGPKSDFEIVIEIETFFCTRKVVRKHEGEDPYGYHPTGFVYADKSWSRTISRDVVWSSKDVVEAADLDNI